GTAGGSSGWRSPGRTPGGASSSSRIPPSPTWTGATPSSAGSSTGWTWSTGSSRTTGSRRSNLPHEREPTGPPAPRPVRGRAGSSGPDGPVREVQGPVPPLPVARPRRRTHRRLLLPRGGANRAARPRPRRGNVPGARATVPAPSVQTHPPHHLRVAPTLRADEPLPGLHPRGRPRVHGIPQTPGRPPVPRRLRAVPPDAAPRAGPRLPDLQAGRDPGAPPRSPAFFAAGRALVDRRSRRVLVGRANDRR